MSDIHVALKPETVFEIGSFPITNAMFSSFIISALLIIVFVVTAKRMKLVPGKGQLFIESFVMGMYNFVYNMFHHEKAARKVFPLFATLALFFLMSNLLGYVPGLAAVKLNDVTAFRSPTTDYSMIFAITMFTFVIWQMVALVTGGLAGYTKQFFDFSGPKSMLPINIFLGVLNIIGEVAKIVSLSFRLFGNIFAGEVIAIVLFSIAPLLVPVPFTALTLLSSVIQAFVFPILVAIFIQMAIVMQDEMQEEKPAGDADVAKAAA